MRLYSALITTLRHLSVSKTSLLFISFFALFAGVQYLKGRPLDSAIEFGIVWSLITLTIVVVSRAYYYSKNTRCEFCESLMSQPDHKTD